MLKNPKIYEECLRYLHGNFNNVFLIHVVFVYNFNYYKTQGNVLL
jgi:hypothetical protein